MPKRKRVKESNTLHNYFSANPAVKKNGRGIELNNSLDSSMCSETGTDIESEVSKSMISPSSKRTCDSDEEVRVAPKRKRVQAISSDSSDTSDTENAENKADNKMKKSKEKSSVGKKLQARFSVNSEKSPKAAKPIAKAPSNGTPSKPPVSQEAPVVADDDNWVHCRLDWLKPDKIRDASNRRPDHPDYDPTTLYVPPAFLKTQTPAHRQWWEMKSKHYDCVLFFKVGKFYELYHMDAAVGVNELGFSYMKGEFAHSGFPESAYSRMASTLASKGYKVARVEQTETPDMMQERCRKTPNTKQDKVVRREICQITVRGTQVCSLQDPGPAEASTNYIVAIAEDESQGCSTYGVCFLDASIGHFNLGQFKDDKHSSRLLTTLAHYPPALLVYDRKSTSGRTCKLLSSHCHNARREPRALWTPEKTLKTLADKYYKTDADGDWPEGLRPFLNEGALGLSPAESCYLAVKALGGVVAYLTECLLDIQILTMSQFSQYAPPDVLNKTLSQGDKVDHRLESGTMVLDAISLRNLRVVQDNGCLYDKLNICSSPMGKRLLYQWVCAPSCSLSVIKERQEAVKVLFESQELCQDVRNVLKGLPDLERLLAKVHALGNSARSKRHPDARAIFYEDKIYSKRKVNDFLALLKGFTAAMKMADLFADVDSSMLKRITQYPPEGNFPNYESTLKFFRDGFDQAQAEKEGRIVPESGVDEEYDASVERIAAVQRELDEYLVELGKQFRCKLSYVGSDKKRFQIEMPLSAAAKAGSEFSMESSRKGFKRFSTSRSKDLLARMIAAEEQKSNALKDLCRRIFEKFSAHYNQWQAAVRCLATLDILLAFAEFAREQTGDICLPEVTFDERKPYIRIVEGRHPCIPIVTDFIPNDTELGGNNSLLLLTGPNMGGKSTLMRQVGLLTLLAHLGSYVPAQECSLSLVDRIFTRLGASDDILSGQSTFLVEMNETAAIVKHATIHSLVLLDELGRGTSTYDGTAIASGVCVELADRACRTVFSTHYHSLVHHLASHPGVLLGHMACMVETDESTPDNEDHIPEEVITFLYKLSPGACPKSYGFNAALLAGIPRDITRKAHRISKQLETEATVVRAFRDLVRMESAGSIRNLLQQLCL